MTSTAAVLLAVIGALAAAVASVLVAARRFSGSIANTEASRLWDASEQMRKEYHERIEDLSGRILRLENRNDDLTRENESLRRTVADQAYTIERLKAEVARLSEENKKLAEVQNGANQH